jgi:hypothetical protein
VEANRVARLAKGGAESGADAAVVGGSEIERVVEDVYRELLVGDSL